MQKTTDTVSKDTILYISLYCLKQVLECIEGVQLIIKFYSLLSHINNSKVIYFSFKQNIINRSLVVITVAVSFQLRTCPIFTNRYLILITLRQWLYRRDCIALIRDHSMYYSMSSIHLYRAIHVKSVPLQHSSLLHAMSDQNFILRARRFFNYKVNKF